MIRNLIQERVKEQGIVNMILDYKYSMEVYEKHNRLMKELLYRVNDYNSATPTTHTINIKGIKQIEYHKITDTRLAILSAKYNCRRLNKHYEYVIMSEEYDIKSLEYNTSYNYY